MSENERTAPEVEDLDVPAQQAGTVTGGEHHVYKPKTKKIKTIKADLKHRPR